jgi:Anti-sigma-28 factor, FlgM
MRIDGQLPAQDAQAADGTRRTTSEAVARQGGPASTPATPSDRVELSGDAALFTFALKAASDAPEIRPDAVERARRKLELGQVAADPVQLAEAILNDLLK